MGSGANHAPVRCDEDGSPVFGVQLDGGSAIEGDMRDLTLVWRTGQPVQLEVGPIAKQALSDAEYAATQAQLVALAAVIHDMDLPGFLDRINHAEEVAPITDPTLWIRGSGKLAQVKRLASAANAFRNEVLRQVEAETIGGRR